jgi:hypothetical protein
MHSDQFRAIIRCNVPPATFCTWGPKWAVMVEIKVKLSICLTTYTLRYKEICESGAIIALFLTQILNGSY